MDEKMSGNQEKAERTINAEEAACPAGEDERHRKRVKRSKKEKKRRKEKRRKSKKSKKDKSERKEKKRRHHRSDSSSSSFSSSSSWSSSSLSSNDSRERRKKEHATLESDIKLPVPGQSSKANAEEDDDDLYGPVAPFAHKAGTAAGLSLDTSAKDYGGQLLAGEGAAIAAYVKQNERIPRRGEVGWDGDKIKHLEEIGYVMSGSRHKRMEAVRKRKENQIFSAEEKRLLLINETQKRTEREAKVLEEMRHLIKKKEHEEASKKLQPS